MKQSIPILALAAIAISFSTGCLSVTGFDGPGPVQAVEDSLRVSVFAQPAQAASETLARNVAIAASQKISGRGFRVVESESPDVAVAFDVTQTEVNRAGDFIMYEGRVNGRVLLPANENRVVDEKSFSERGERALGVSAATAKLSSVLLPKVEAWVSETLTAEKLAIEVVSVGVEYRHVRASRKASLVDEFVKAATGTPGIRDCRLVAETWYPGWWGATYGATYRIVYDATAFPNGPLNTIALRNPGLGLSVLPAAPIPAAR